MDPIAPKWTAEEWYLRHPKRRVLHSCGNARACDVFSCPKGGHLIGRCQWNASEQLCAGHARKAARRRRNEKQAAERRASRPTTDCPAQPVRHELPPGVTRGTHLLCRKKFRYETRSLAKHWADRFETEGGLPHMRAYHCELCDGWHLTSDGKASKNKTPSRLATEGGGEPGPTR